MDFIPQVAFVAYKNGFPVAYMTFDAAGTDKLNWFSKSKLLTNGWGDLDAHGNNFFRLVESHELMRVKYIYNLIPLPHG